MKKTIPILSLLMISLLVSACTPEAAPPAQQTDTAQQPTVVETAPTPAEEPQSEVKDVTIELFNWGINQEGPAIEAGDKVRLKVTSTDGTHGIMIPGLGLSTEKIGPGQEQIIEFTATEAGNYEYFCNVPCGSGHRSMRSTLVVEP